MATDEQPRLLAGSSREESRRVADILRQETTGGALLMAATVAALGWANSPSAEQYVALRDRAVGPHALHLHLTLGAWAADGLLAIFFFVAGLELKRELVEGELRDPRRAALPVAAAVGGMLVPAAVYTAVTWASEGARAGWAIPTATDIAFALAVLGLVGTHLPSGLRTFLLTLAVVDDLLAITVIAVFYTSDLTVWWLAVALLPLAMFALLVRRGTHRWWLLVPLALGTWVAVHASGVHATVAGVLLAFAVPVRGGANAELGYAGSRRAGPAEHLEHAWRPVSAAFAVPVFAFFAAGVDLGGRSGLADALGDPVVLGIIAGLVVGKVLGIGGAAYLVARFTHAELDRDLRWADVAGMASLGGVGFTVSLLIGELAFGPDGERTDRVKVGVLVGSLLAAAIAAAVLRLRNRTYRLLEEADRRRDADDDVA